jgi:hypothetical protein
MSRESIIAEIRKDVALMEHVGACHKTAWRGQDGINRRGGRQTTQGTAEDVRCWSEADCCCSEGTLGEGSNSEEVMLVCHPPWGLSAPVFEPTISTHDSQVSHVFSRT